MGVSLITGIYCLGLSVGWLRFQGVSPLTDEPRSLLVATGIASLITVLGSFNGELVFRGYLLQNLVDCIGLYGALIIMSAWSGLLAAGHPYGTWLGTVNAALLALFFAYGWVRTRQLWLPIGLSIGWSLMYGPVLGLSSGAWLSLTTHAAVGPEWVIGGRLGPQAGIVAIPALLVGAGLIHVWTRGRFEGR